MKLIQRNVLLERKTIRKQTWERNRREGEIREAHTKRRKQIFAIVKERGGS